MRGFFRGIVRTIKIILFLAIIGISWIAGDRFGVPQVVRDQSEVVWGKAVDGSQYAWTESEALIRERIREAAEYSFDWEMPEMPEVSLDEVKIAMTTRDEVEGDDAAEVLDEAEPVVAGETVAEAADIEKPADVVSPRKDVVSKPVAVTLAKLCPRMAVSNAPPAGDDLVIRGLKSTVDVKGVAIRTVPVTEGCLSSGYGPRNGKIHRGVDFHHPTGSTILAAASGTIREAAYREDFGNYLIIEHGKGVYTRYAHLASFGRGIKAGASVSDGQSLGTMGNTAGWQMPIHLHFEVLVGDYDTPKKSFGLTSVNPLTGRA